MDANIFKNVANIPIKTCQAVGLSYSGFLVSRPSEIYHVFLNRFNWVRITIHRIDSCKLYCNFLVYSDRDRLSNGGI
jgi:hypothetical protein